MTLTLPSRIKEAPANSAHGVDSIEDYASQCARFSAAIDIGWEQAKAGKLTSAEDFEVEFEEYKRQWLAARTKS